MSVRKSNGFKWPHVIIVIFNLKTLRGANSMLFISPSSRKEKHRGMS